MSRRVGPEGHTRRSAQRSAIRTCLDHGLQAHRSQADFHIDAIICGLFRQLRPVALRQKRSCCSGERKTEGQPGQAAPQSRSVG